MFFLLSCFTISVKYLNESKRIGIYDMEEYNELVENINDTQLLISLLSSDKLNEDDEKLKYFVNATELEFLKDYNFFVIAVIQNETTKHDYVSIKLKNVSSEYTFDIDYKSQPIEASYKIIKGALHLWKLYRRELKLMKNEKTAHTKEILRSFRRHLKNNSGNKFKAAGIKKNIEKFENILLDQIDDDLKKSVKRIKFESKGRGLLGSALNKMKIKKMLKESGRKELTPEEKEEKKKTPKKQLKNRIKRLRSAKTILYGMIKVKEITNTIKSPKLNLTNLGKTNLFQNIGRLLLNKIIDNRRANNENINNENDYDGL